MLGTHPLDGLVGDVGAGVVIGIGVQIHPVHVVVNDRMKQVSLASHEAVEPLKPAIHRPAVERSDNAGFPRPQFVTFAEHGGVVAVEPQDLGQHRDAGGTHRGVPRESGGNFRDHAEVCAMAIAPGKQGHAARGTQRGHFEVVVAQPVLASRSSVGMSIGPPNVDISEAEVVEKDDHHVGRAFRRFHLESRRGLCIAAHQAR